MFKFVFIVSLLVIVQEVQLQRSPYAGSTNRFRGLPMNIVTTSVSSQNISPSPVTQARSGLTTTSTSTTSTTQQTRTKDFLNSPSIPSRISGGFFSNQNYDEFRNQRNHNHHHGHRFDYREERNFDYDIYD